MSISWYKNKEKMFSKQLASDVVIVFLVQCSQGSEEQTGHQKQEKQCSLSNWLFLRKPVKIKLKLDPKTNFPVKSDNVHIMSLICIMHIP